MKKISVFLLLAFSLVACAERLSESEQALIRRHGGGIMPVMSIAQEADSLLLRRSSAELSESIALSEDFALLKASMLATVRDPENEGVGIAAPQVGILRRVVAVQRFDKKGEPFEFFLNPQIVERSSTTQFGGEGCLSVPDLSGNVERAEWIVLRYRDEAWREHQETIKGFTAVIFQHEVDHLDGRLFIDYLK